MIPFKSLQSKSLFVALWTLLFIAGYLIKNKVSNKAADGDFLIGILLTCVVALGWVGLTELSKTAWKPMAWMLGSIMVVLYLQDGATASRPYFSSVALASVALLAYIAALVGPRHPG